MTPDLLRLRERDDGSVEPAWLSDRDDVWIREALTVVDSRVGHPSGDLEAELIRAMGTTAAQHRVERRALRGVLRVILRDYRRAVEAKLEPAKIRERLFRESALCRSRLALSKEAFRAARDRVVEAAAVALGITSKDVEEGLFADHPSQRLLLPRGEPPTPTEIRERYQLAMLQGCLLRSSAARLWVRSNVRSVARFAKLERLLCTFTVEDGATRIDLSGPLALFHETLKYGRALATFVPSALSTPGWRLEAACTLRDRSFTLRVDAAAPLPRPHALPRAEDSKLEAALARDLRRLRSPWSIVREGTAIHVGSSVIFPDFVLIRGSTRVLVEVVGFWTPEYLSSKLRLLQGIRDVPLIVAVDAERGWTDAELPDAVVIPFKRRIDAARVVDAADQLVSSARA